MKAPTPFQKTIQKIGLYTILTALLFYFAFPLVFMLISSFKTDPQQANRDSSTLKAFIPYGQLGIRNYAVVLLSPEIVRFFINSLFIAGTTVILGLLVNSLLAYSLARRRWRGSHYVFVLIIALMIVPFSTISMPLLLLVNSFGWLDSYQVQIVPFIATPLYVFLFYQFFIGIPKDFSDAAIVDGANPLQIYWFVILPLSQPVIATVTILNFLVSWSAYLWPLITVRNPDYYPLMIGVPYIFQVGRGAASGVIMAFYSLISVPVLILFVWLQKWFIQRGLVHILADR